MSKHKHFEMGVAKLGNTELVLFYKGEHRWVELFQHEMPYVETAEYFLCLPQFTKACLHWLNGGETEFKCQGEWYSCDDWSKEWDAQTCGFMQADNIIRIKPKKVKRWVIWNEDDDSFHCHFKTNPNECYQANFKFSIHEIEVEE